MYKMNQTERDNLANEIVFFAVLFLGLSTLLIGLIITNINLFGFGTFTTIFSFVIKIINNLKK